MGATASLSEHQLTVDPGGETTCEVQVRNTGDVVDGFILEVLGDAADWTTVEPPELRLFPGDDGTATVRFHPPRSTEVPEGEVPFGIKITSTDDPTSSVVEEGTLTVGAFVDLFAEVFPRTSRGRRKGRHEVAVDNRSNTRVTARLAASDPDDLLEIEVDPDEIAAEADTATFAKVTPRPTRTYWRGPPVTRPFQVQVSTAGREPIVLDATFLQEALVPNWLPKAAAMAALGAIALVALWAVALKPTIESAAQDAVEDPLQELAQDNAAQAAQMDAIQNATIGLQSDLQSLIGGDTPGPDATETPAPGESPRPRLVTSSPFDVRLTATDEPGGGGAEDAFTVPEEATLELTDLVLQNPAGHPGLIRLQRVTEDDTITLIEVALENFRDLDYHFVSPIVFTEGSQVVFEVECAEEAEVPCEAGAYLSGTMTGPVEAEEGTGPGAGGADDLVAP